MVVAITRSDLSADELRLVARRSKDSCQARRLLALAQVLDGRPRGEAARAGGMDRQTLRDWVHRYNAQGVDGLCDRRRSGRPSRLPACCKPGSVNALRFQGSEEALHGGIEAPIFVKRS